MLRGMQFDVVMYIAGKVKSQLRIPVISHTHSGVIRTLIPGLSAHSFRANPHSQEMRNAG